MPGSRVTVNSICCGDPSCFCADSEEYIWPEEDAGVSQEFCEMWGEIALAHEAAVECREFHWPPIGRSYSWLKTKHGDKEPRLDMAAFERAIAGVTASRVDPEAYWRQFRYYDEAYQVDAAALERVLAARRTVSSGGAYTITATSPRMPQATAADFSNPNPRTYGISWSPEFALNYSGGISVE